MSIRWVLRGRARRGATGLTLVLTGAVFFWLSFASSAQAQGVSGSHPAKPESRLASVLAQSGGLTAADAARRASEASIEALVRREQVVIAETAREKIIWEAAPRLTLTARTTRLSEVDAPNFAPPGAPAVSFPQPQTQHFLNAGLIVPLSDYLLRTVKAVRGARTNQAAAVLEERAARVTAASNAKLGYYDWVRARLEGVVAAQALSQASAQLARTQALQGVGRAPEADLLQARAFEADARLALLQTETQGDIAEERLRVSMGALPNERLRIGEDVLAEFPAASEVKAEEELYREALERRLEMQALGKSQAALDDLGSIEASRAWPRLEAFGNLTYANPNQRVFPLEERWNTTWDVGLQLLWAVNDLGTAGTQARTVRSQLAQLEHQRTGVERALRVEVVTALGALEQARSSVSTAQEGERAADAAYLARQRLAEQGMGTTSELIQAETARVRARLNVVNAHIALRVARVQLDHALGRDVPPQPNAD